MWIHDRVKVCKRKGVCFLLLFVVSSILIDAATANLILIGRNMSVSFEDIEANFAPSVKGSGERGILYVAEPLDACSQLTNIISKEMGPSFALIIRGGCSFDDKVRKAQNAGFKAAIVYDNEDGGILVAMAGSSAGIKIPAVFISKRSGDVLKKYSGLPDMEIWIIPTFENSAWSIMAISFICLLSMSALLATCFFVRRHRIRRERPRSAQVREFHGMSNQLVKAMPSLIFTSVLEDNCTSQTCAICLDDYSVGDKLRILPCRHKFHAACVDSWLTTWRAFCPICKRDARKTERIPPASECTPLLSSNSVYSSSSVASSFPSVAPSPVIQIAPSPLSRSSSTRSFRSSFAPSPIIQVPPQRFSPSSSLPSSFRSFLAVSPPMQTPSTSSQYSNIRTPPLTVSRHLPRPPRSFNNLHALSQSRSTLDLRNSSFQRSHTSRFALPRSLGNSLNSGYYSRDTSSYIPTAYVPSPSNASPGFIGSSGRQPCLLHCSESSASFSPLASAQSLPGC